MLAQKQKPRRPDPITFGWAATGVGRERITYGFQDIGFLVRGLMQFGWADIGRVVQVAGFGSKVTGDSATISKRPRVSLTILNSAVMWHLVAKRKGCETEVPIRRPRISPDRVFLSLGARYLARLLVGQR